MTVGYYLWLDNEAKGPFTIGQLRGMWSAGQLTGENLFSTNAGEEWRPLSDIVEMLEITAARETPLPPIPQVVAITQKRRGNPLTPILIIATVLSIGFGIINSFPDEVEKAQKNVLDMENENLTNSEQLSRYADAEAKVEELQGINVDRTSLEQSAENLEQEKEDRDKTSDDYHKIKGNREALELCGFVIAGFCFLCSLITFGISRLR